MIRISNQKLDAILLMGVPKRTPGEHATEIAKGMERDGEVYLEGLDKSEIELFGKKVGRMFFEEISRATRLAHDVRVIGPAGLRTLADEYSAGLQKNFYFIHQGKNRWDNIERAAAAKGSRGMTYLAGTDLPLAQNIDGRIEEHGKLLPINLRLMGIEDFGSFWRNPFIFYNDLLKHQPGESKVIQNRAYKEPTDYIVDLGEVSFEELADLDFGTKMSDPIKYISFLHKMMKLSLEHAGVRETFNGLGHLVQMKKVHKNSGFHKDSEAYGYPAGMKSASMKALREYAGRLLNLYPDDINAGESANSGFYMDLDSVQDAFRHAKMIWKGLNRNQNVKFEELKGEIRYKGVPILEVPEIKRHITSEADFFKDLYKKERLMENFTHHAKDLYQKR